MPLPQNQPAADATHHVVVAPHEFFVLGQGEMVGSIDASFRRLANFLRDRAQARLLALSSLIEPLMLLIGGGMLMLLAVGIFMPIYGAMKNIGH